MDNIAQNAGGGSARHWASPRDRTVGIGLLLLTAISIVAVLISNRLATAYGFQPTKVGDAFGIRGLAIFFAFPVWILLRLLDHFRQKNAHPAKLIGRELWGNRYHFALVLYLFALLLINAGAFTIFKTLIPHLRPFYADHLIGNFERRLFGADIWVYTHRLIGIYPSAFIELCYGLWHIANSFVVLWLLFTKDYTAKFRGLTTIALSWFLLGGLLATTYSSVGPIFFDHFYGGSRFSGLLQELRGVADVGTGATLKSRAFLLQSYGTQTFGSGISAMPSLHVGLAFIWFLLARHRGSYIARLSAGFFAIIFLGSFHLGWHWLSDGVVAIILICPIWAATGFLFRPRDQRPNETADHIASLNA